MCISCQVLLVKNESEEVLGCSHLPKETADIYSFHHHGYHTSIKSEQQYIPISYSRSHILETMSVINSKNKWLKEIYSKLQDQRNLVTS